jgi:Raf kinase inhibitor-like YbhB/YbcL family protein
MEITSPAFEHYGKIPKLYTCDGTDISPPLSWSDVPEDAKSLVLIVDDPDAPDPTSPKMTWVHWLIYNLPADSTGLPENYNSETLSSADVGVGVNDWKRNNYGGPCPPIGEHRYFYKLYALDTPLEQMDNPTKSDILQAMENHVLASAELVGIYKH